MGLHSCRLGTLIIQLKSAIIKIIIHFALLRTQGFRAAALEIMVYPGLWGFTQAWLSVLMMNSNGDILTVFVIMVIIDSVCY